MSLYIVLKSERVCNIRSSGIRGGLYREISNRMHEEETSMQSGVCRKRRKVEPDGGGKRNLEAECELTQCAVSKMAKRLSPPTRRGCEHTRL